jgi:hypothetical protein
MSSVGKTTQGRADARICIFGASAGGAFVEGWMFRPTVGQRVMARNLTEKYSGYISSAMDAADKSALAGIELAATEVITLSEGLEREELLRSRITGAEVRKRLIDLGAAMARISDPTKSSLSELDYAGWLEVCVRLEAGGPSSADALWFATQALVPATLDWIRVYQAERPEWFG